MDRAKQVALPSLGARIAGSLSVRVCAVFLAMDAAFDLLVVPAYGELARCYAPADTQYLSGTAAGVGVAVLSAWLLSMVVLLTPLRRWLSAEAQGDLSIELMRRAAARAHGAPRWFAALWSLKWLVLCSALSLVWGAPTHPALLFFFGALATGPLPLAYLLTAWLLSDLTARLSVPVVSGAKLDLPWMSLRGQLVALSLCLCIAPSLYVCSIALAEGLPSSTRLWMVLLFLAAIVLFALLCAALFADSIVRPVRVMVDTVGAIADLGDVSQAARVPQLRHDEIGGLAERINRMVDRLETVELEHAIATRAVESLNQSLERRVDDRTRSLAESNALLGHEMTTRLQLEIELRQAQKLESVGRLAAGIAHEINTPLQFIGDNLTFIDQASGQLLELVHTYKRTWQRVAASQPPELSEALARAEQQADLDYLSGDARKAMEQAAEGLQRVTRIVTSMRDFAHPDHKEKTPCDLNQAIESTLVVASHEYKHCADIETDLGELPLLSCHVGSLNQAILNILINAAQAIVDAGRPERGRICIRTWVERARIAISIADTGHGIPDAIRDRVFDPFFTTKEVGRGSGQGLAICRSVIVDQHGGELDFMSSPGQGTTFFIRLPIDLATHESIAPLDAVN